MRLLTEEAFFISDIPRQLPPSDVRLLSIQNLDGVLCGQSVVPELTIKNQGSTVLTSVTVNYSFDGGSTQTYNWTGSLNSEETTSISLPQSSLNIGLHNLDIETTTTNDAYDINNTLSQSFILNDASENPTQINSFENIDDALLTQNKNSEDSLWEIAEPNKTLLDTNGSGILAYVTGAGEIILIILLLTYIPTVMI